MSKIIDLIKKYKTVIYGLAACIVLLVFLVLLADIVIMPILTHHGIEKELPDVTELTFEDAQKVLAESGFTIIKDGEKFDDHYEAGTVISQNPLPFSSVKKGRRIYVIVSAGEKMVKVPKITGSSERESEFVLKQAGLVLGEIFYEYDNYYPKSVVCRQSLPEGSEVKEQEIIDITVSLGHMPASFIVPDVSGRSLEEAGKIIQKAGLKIGKVTKRKNRKLLPDTVIDQSPDPGEETERGAKVDLVVSSLKEEDN